jgi:hypothetical protein
MALRRRPAIGERQDVLVNEDLRRCVAFLCVDELNEETGVTNRRPAATAFFVSVPIEDNAWICYAVTARHAIDRSQDYDALYLRVNTQDGYEDVKVPQDAWVTHPTTDVAVARVADRLFGSTHPYAPKALSIDRLVTDEFAQQHSIGEGDEVIFIGLFVNYWGADQAQPIARFGNISLGTRGKVPLRLNPSEDLVPVDAYLVEARSWGGQSGSPAFVSFTPDRELMVTGKFRQEGLTGILLGLVHGHYEIKTDVEFIGDITGSGHVNVNAGMAAVIPAQKIRDTLMERELEEEREDERRELAKRRSAPRPDTGSPVERYQRSDFMRDLKKVAKKQDRPSRPDQEMR